MDKRLPKNVVFKGDNGMYMAALRPPKLDHVYIGKQQPPKTDHVYLMFCMEDKLNARCRHIIEYINDSDGIIRIKSNYYDKYWRGSPNWIWVDSNDTSTNNRDTLFQLVKISEDTYALKNLGNGLFCKRLTADYLLHCLSASAESMVTEACLKVEEAVVSRKISKIEYRTEEAKIHADKNKVITLTSRQAVNNGNTADKMMLGLRYNITKKRTWDSSVSMKFGVKTTIEAGIPEVASENIEISSEYGSEYNWGETKEDTEENTTQYEVTVPPHTKVIVSVVATEATCDVPFSYIQEDVMISGEKVITPFHDGIYRGVNSIDVKIVHSPDQKI